MNDHLHSSIFGRHDVDEADRPADPPPMTRREAREVERRASRRGGRKPSRLRRLAVLLGALVVLGGATLVAFTVLRPVVMQVFEANDYPGPGKGTVRITIEEGDSGSAIAQRRWRRHSSTVTPAMISSTTPIGPPSWVTRAIGRCGVSWRSTRIHVRVP